jgi:hypothetical protein
MAWEYMSTLDYRYKNANKVLQELEIENLGHVVELCSGNTQCANYLSIPFESYRACDLIVPIDTPTNVEFFQETVEDFIVKRVNECDTLFVFGHGGHEITKETLESKYLTSCMHEIVEKHNPSVIILEMVKRFEAIGIKFIKESGYMLYETIYNDNDNWLEDRVMFVLRR